MSLWRPLQQSARFMIMTTTTISSNQLFSFWARHFHPEFNSLGLTQKAQLCVNLVGNNSASEAEPEVVSPGKRQTHTTNGLFYRILALRDLLISPPVPSNSFCLPHGLTFASFTIKCAVIGRAPLSINGPKHSSKIK